MPEVRERGGYRLEGGGGDGDADHDGDVSAISSASILALAARLRSLTVGGRVSVGEGGLCHRWLGDDMVTTRPASLKPCHAAIRHKPLIFNWCP
jgi:hypothetical protein